MIKGLLCTLLLLLSFGDSQVVQYCIYNQHFIINSASTYLLGGYDTTLTYHSSQSPVAHSYVLMGYKTTTANKYWSFTASLSSVTNTNAILNVNPSSVSGQMTYAHFGIILVNDCGGGQVYLSYMQLNLVQLALVPSSRSSNYEMMSLNAGSVFTGAAADYKYEAIISCFTYTINSIKKFQLQLQLSAPTIGTSNHVLNVTSDKSEQNIFTQIYITYIRVNIPSFTNTAYKIFQSTHISIQSNNKVTVNPEITSNSRQKCLIGLTFIYLDDFDKNNMFIDINDGAAATTTYSFSSASSIKGSYSSFCVSGCNANYFPSGSTCLQCSSFLPNCITCTSKILCAVCPTGYYINSSGGCSLCVSPCVNCNNLTYCTSCIATYFTETVSLTVQNCATCLPQCLSCSTSTTCITCKVDTGVAVLGGCTNQLYCTQVDSALTNSTNRCLACDPTLMFVLISGACACPTGYTDLGAVCSDVIGCTAATQLTTTTSNCISCDTTLNYDPTAVLNQCVCAAGFYMDALNLTTQCQSCLPECATCSNAITCDTCTSSNLVTGGCTTIPNCLQVDSTMSFASNRCLLCDPTSMFVLSGGTCICLTGFTAVGTVCSDVIGCASAVQLTTTTSTCTACDTTVGYLAALAPGNICVCATGFYMDALNLTNQCQSCRPECATCSDSITCDTCASSTLVTGGCTSVLFCTQVDSTMTFTSNRCLVCDPTSMFILVNGTCACLSGFYPVGSVCSEVVGCASATPLTTTTSTCHTCDTALNYISLPVSNQCQCTVGFFLQPSNPVQCQSCRPECSACSDSITCDYCASSTLVIGGCTNLLNCLSVDSNLPFTTNRCTSCTYVDASLAICSGCTNIVQYVLIGGVCSECRLSYCLDCVDTATCQTCASGYTINALGRCHNCNVIGCAECDLIDPNNCAVCHSAIGYTSDGLGSCITTCGDGLTVSAVQQCDDGNTVDGDGCSSACLKQTDYTCTVNAALLSVCTNMVCGDGIVASTEACDDANTIDGDGCSSICQKQMEITLSAMKSRLDQCNTIDFEFFVDAGYGNLNSFDFTSFLVFNLTQLKPKSWDFSQSKLTISYTFTSSLQSLSAGVFINPATIAAHPQYGFILSPTSFIVTASNNVPLTFIDEQTCQLKQSLSTGFTIIQMSSFAVLFTALFFGKIIGLELIGVLQTEYFCIGSLSPVNPLLTPLMSMKILNGYSAPLINSSTDQLPSRIREIQFHPSFLDNFNVMLGVLMGTFIVGLSLFIIMKIFQIQNSFFAKVTNTILKQVFITILLFCSLNIAYSSGVYYRFSEKDLFATLCSVASLAAIAVMAMMFPAVNPEGFGEFKDKFKASAVQSNYMTITLIFRLLLGFFLAFNNESHLSTLFVLGISLAFILYNLINLPYAQAYHNYRACICHLSQFVIIFVTMYYRSMKSTTNVVEVASIYEPAKLEFAALSITLVMSAGVLFYDAYMKIKQICSKNKPNQRSKFEYSQGNIGENSMQIQSIDLNN